MPLGYLDFNGRPFGMAALASGHQEAVLVKVQSVWEATFAPRQPPPVEIFSSSMDGSAYTALFNQGLMGIPSL